MAKMAKAVKKGGFTIGRGERRLNCRNYMDCLNEVVKEFPFSTCQWRCTEECPYYKEETVDHVMTRLNYNRFETYVITPA